MVKKTYISPEMLTVQLGTCHMMAESFTINNDPSNAITSEGDILTKESVSDVNLWDEEW